MDQKRMLINATQRDEVRVAITQNTQLIDLDIEVPGQEQKKANIYKGVISSIEPSLGAAFVNYGSERHGFLPLKEISREYFLAQGDQHPENVDIRKVLKEGQPVVVQVEKEERGTKGAALTTFISLAGSFLVLMPNNPRAGGISRRIEGDEREHLREAISQLTLPEGMGIIIRTAGVGKSKEELEWDLNILLRYWEAIKQAATIKTGAYLIHQESDVIIRGIRDYLRQDINEIIIDEENSFKRAHNYISQIRPDLASRLKLYNDSLPLFSRFQIEQQIESAYQREVRLPSGGSIVIDHTEALVSVDINSAKATKGSNIEETALNTNLEAAEEIARQLRIRDIGGLIVIDFIDMTPTRNQREVENCLRNALRPDRARIQIGRISRFGLLEMSRQRIRSALTRANHMTCPRCEGRGNIRSIESQALSILHLVQEQAVKAKHAHFQLQLPLDIATYVTNEKRSQISEIEETCQVKITIIPNESLESPHYTIKQTKCNSENLEHGKGIASYKLLKSYKPEAGTQKRQPARPASEPAMNQFLSSANTPKKTIPTKDSTNGGGLIKKLWTKMFGSEEEIPPATQQPAKKQSRPQHQRSQNRRPSGQGNKQRVQGNRRNNEQKEQGQGQGQGQGQRKPQKRKPSERKTNERKPSEHKAKDHKPNENPAKTTNANNEQQQDTKNRTRRGSRGGHQRNNQNRKPAPEHVSARNKQPYPEDMDSVLPKSENPNPTPTTAQPPKVETKAATASQKVATKPVAPSEKVEAKPATANQQVETKPATANQQVQTKPATASQQVQTKPATASQQVQTKPATANQQVQTKPATANQQVQTKPATTNQQVETKPVMPSEPVHKPGPQKPKTDKD